MRPKILNRQVNMTLYRALWDLETLGYLLCL